MMKRVEQHVESAIKKTFKSYKETNFSDQSIEIITKVIKEFVNNLNKRIDLDKAYKSTRTKESELVENIQQVLLTSSIKPDKQILDQIKELMDKYKR